jgi:hypothetical protein
MERLQRAMSNFLDTDHMFRCLKMASLSNLEGMRQAMSLEDKPEIVSAKLTHVKWWRAALNRLGVGRDRGYEETLERYAHRDVSDTLGEEDLKSWLSLLDGEPGGRKPRSGRRPKP